MKFFDSAKIYVKAGDGGGGCISFRREKFIEFGGPDGGNGGKGASVYLKAVNTVSTLIDFKYKQHIKASNGRNGAGRNRTGENGKDIIMEVPLGTIILDENKNILADLKEEEQTYKIAQGGRGGKGNNHFKSSTNKTPRIAQPGTKGEELIIYLELEILADVGLIGLPNAGKSTFLNTITNAKSKVANYPFTTLEPKLGVLQINYKQIVIADLPGIIKGATEGSGLGDKFLNHIKRCKVFIHMIDSTEDIIKSYNVIINELEKYDNMKDLRISEKKQIVILNKIDLLSENDIKQKMSEISKVTNNTVLCISAREISYLNTIIKNIEPIFNLNNEDKNSIWSPI